MPSSVKKELNVTKNNEFIFNGEEKFVGKRGEYSSQYFLLFLQYFFPKACQKLLSAEMD